jgi:hypothetical protein
LPVSYSVVSKAQLSKWKLRLFLFRQILTSLFERLIRLPRWLPDPMLVDAPQTMLKRWAFPCPAGVLSFLFESQVQWTVRMLVFAFLGALQAMLQAGLFFSSGRHFILPFESQAHWPARILGGAF